MKLEYFVVLTAEGQLVKRRGQAPRLYRNKGTAQAVAWRDGDSVVVASIDLDMEPVFIRGKVV